MAAHWHPGHWVLGHWHAAHWGSTGSAQAPEPVLSTAIAYGRPIVLRRPFALATAGRYANPGNAADLLPRVYGDFAEGGLAGPCPTVLIDRILQIYAAADTPVEAITHVYVGPEEVLEGFTVALSDDVEGQGAIATITFPETQPFGAVTWRGRGKPGVDGLLLRNPIAQLVDLLTTLGDIEADQLDHGSQVEAEAACAGLGYETAWVVQDHRMILDWITEWNWNVLGFTRIRGDERLAFLVDRGHWPTADELIANIVAARDCEGGDDDPAWEVNTATLVNMMDVEYAWMWYEYTPAETERDIQDAVSVNAMGALRSAGPYQLRAHRHRATVETWAAVMFERLSFRDRAAGATVSLTVSGGKLAHAATGDLFGLSWPWGPGRERGELYVNQILRVMRTSIDPNSGGRVEVSALDTGKYLVGAGSATYFDAAVLLDAALPLGGGQGRLTTQLPWEGTPVQVAV